MFMLKRLASLVSWLMLAFDAEVRAEMPPSLADWQMKWGTRASCCDQAIRPIRDVRVPRYVATYSYTDLTVLRS